MTARGSANRPSVLLSSLHLAALWALSFVWPLFNLIGADQFFFVARGNEPIDILIFAFGYALVPPLIFFGSEALVDRISSIWRWRLHLGLVAALLAGLFLQAMTGPLASIPSPLLLLIAASVGTLGAFLYSARLAIRTLATYLTPAPLVVLALFLLTSPGTGLLRSGDEPGVWDLGLSKNHPVVVLVFDEFPTSTLMNRSGEIDSRRFPTFAELSREGTWYRNHTTLSDNTMLAVPEILTGKEAKSVRVPVSSSFPESLFTALGAEYSVHSHESVTQICPTAICGKPMAMPLRSRLRQLAFDLRYAAARQVLPRSMAANLPNVGTTFGAITEADTAGRFVAVRYSAWSPEDFKHFLDAMPSQGSFSYLQTELPHEPWQFLPSGERYSSSDLTVIHSEDGKYFGGGGASRVSLAQRHFLQTAYADSLVKLLRDKLIQDGVWDDALVIVTADHGVSLDPEEPRRVLTSGNAPEILNPILFIKYPGGHPAGISDVHTRTIDLLPTVIETLGGNVPGELDGRPISTLGDGPREVRTKSGEGGEVTLSVGALRRMRAQVVARHIRWLGDGPNDRLGPEAELVDKDLSELEVGESSNSFRLAVPEQYENVDLSQSVLPAFPHGVLSGVDAGETLAIAINGTVSATTRAFEFRGNTWFGAVIDKSVLRQGRNQVDVLIVNGPGALTQLAPG